MESEQIQSLINHTHSDLPKGWVLRKLGTLVKLINGYAFKPEDWKTEGLPIIRIQNLNDASAGYNYFDGQVDEKYYVNKGDLLFAWSGTKGVSFGARVWKGGAAILNQHIFRVVPIKIDPDYCFYLLRGAQEAVEKNAHGFKSTFVHVTKGDLEKIAVKIPVDLSQQRKIAAILSAWDKAIQTANQLLKVKQERKHGLMQQLLTGQKRLPGFAGEWREVKLGEICSRLTRRNGEGNTNVLTISAQVGLISQRDFFNKSVASEEVKNYFLLRRGEFAYNKSYSAGYPYGAIKRLEYYEKGILSPLYICLGIANGDSDFFAHFFEYGALNHGIYRIAQEGARNHGLLNISAEDFFQMPIQIPELDEQKVIAAVLNAADEEISLAKQEADALKQQKRGLMQELLMGKTLVTVDEQKHQHDLLNSTPV